MAPLAAGPLISAATLRDLLGEPATRATIRIFDVRWYLARPGAGRQAYAAGHLPGAAFMDFDGALASPTGPGRHPLPSPAAFGRSMEAAGVRDGDLVVAYDDAGGGIAARLWWMLDALGHAEVRVLDGGIDAWVAAGGALETGEDGSPGGDARTGEAAPPGAKARTGEAGLPGAKARTGEAAMPGAKAPSGEAARAGEAARTGGAALPDATGHLTLAPRWPRVIDRDVLRSRLGGVLLFDVRAPERYRGDVEPVDRVPGHIPTAVNAPIAGNLAADGRFLPPEVLHARYTALGVAEAAAAGRSVVVSCGSGANACQAALAMRAAGLPDPILYEGSYSDWSASLLPIATGDDPGDPA